VSGWSLDTFGKLLAFAAVVEVGTGLILMTDPAIVVTLLLGAAGVRAMLIYNVLIAAYLGYLGTAGHPRGLFLWPAVGLHAVVALLLVWTWRTDDGR